MTAKDAYAHQPDRRGRRSAWALGLVASLTLAGMLTTRVARAGNLDAFYLSGDAALQAGAITADASGGGAAWYNPAGLAGLAGLRFDVGVNGYAIRFGGEASLLPAVPETNVTRFTRLDLNVVPTALTLTRRFGKLGVAVGAFVPTQSATVLRTQFQTPASADGTQLDYAYDASSRLQSYHAGFALGTELAPGLSVGGAFLFSYQTLVTDLSTSLITDRAGGTVTESTHFTLDSIQVGSEMVLGLQWQLHKRWRLGLVLRSPALRLGERAQVVDTFQITGPSGTAAANVFSQSLAIGTTIISPFRFHAGISHDFLTDYHVSVDASLLLPFVDQRLGVRLRPTYNARVGIRRKFGPRLAVGGGLFTDLSPNDTPRTFQDSQIDNYGVTLALEFGRTYGIHSENGVTYERPKALTFNTTVALSYALGAGSVMQAQVRSDADGSIVREDSPQKVLAHEIMLHLGSSVLE